MKYVLIAKAIVINQQGKMLIVQRASQQQYGANVWSTPGGHVEVGESFEQAAQRELREETGLQIDGCMLLKSEVRKAKEEDTELMVAQCVFRLTDEQAVSLALDELQDFKWVNQQEAIKYRKSFGELFEEVKRVL